MQTKFIIHEAVLYDGKIARVEEIAVAADGEYLYLVQFTNHFYKWIPEQQLERYIG